MLRNECHISGSSLSLFHDKCNKGGSIFYYHFGHTDYPCCKRTNLYEGVDVLIRAEGTDHGAEALRHFFRTHFQKDEQCKVCCQCSSDYKSPLPEAGTEARCFCTRSLNYSVICQQKLHHLSPCVFAECCSLPLPAAPGRGQCWRSRRSISLRTTPIHEKSGCRMSSVIHNL